jgi:hypothetical protein
MELESIIKVYQLDIYVHAIIVASEDMCGTTWLVSP